MSCTTLARVLVLTILGLLLCGLVCADTTADLRIVNDVRLAPVPVVAQWLGATVSADAAEHSVTVRLGNTALHLLRGNKLATLNGAALLLETAPAEFDNVLYVPVSVLAKAFKIDQRWETMQAMVTLTRTGIAQPLVLTYLPTTSDVFTAIEGGDLASVQALLARNPQLLDAKNGQNTPLVYAINHHQSEIACWLISQGADVKPELPQHMTLLHLAASYGTVELVALLVQKGLDVNATADMQITPLHCACMDGAYDVAESAAGARRSSRCLAAIATDRHADPGGRSPHVTDARLRHADDVCPDADGCAA